MLNKDIVNLLLDSADVSVRNEKKEGIRFLVKSGHDIELSTRIVKQFNYRWLNVKKNRYKFETKYSSWLVEEIVSSVAQKENGE